MPVKTMGDRDSVPADWTDLWRLRRSLADAQAVIERGAQACASSTLLLRQLGEPFDHQCPMCRAVTRHQIRHGQVICLTCAPD